MSEERFADVTMDELVAEIERRCDSFVLSMLEKSKQKIPSQNYATIYFNGGFYNALGLAQQIVHDLLTRNPRVCNQDQETGDPDASEPPT